MKITHLTDEINVLKALIERWSELPAAPTIERDIALSNLQQIYRQLLSLPTQITITEQLPATVAEPITMPESATDQPSIVEFIVTTEEDSSIEQDVPEQSTDRQVSPTEEIAPEKAEEIEVVVENTEDKEEVIEEESIKEPEFRMLFGQSVSRNLVDTFVRELFWRDEQFFADEISKLSHQPDLDAALFYICEKYNWSAYSVAAEQFTGLLANHTFEQ